MSCGLADGLRPREKLLRVGPEGMTDQELVALLLGVGSHGHGDAMTLAGRTLGRFDGLAGLRLADPWELAELRGMGQVKACRIVAAMELARRASAARLAAGPVVTCPKEVFELYGPILGHMEQEVFLVLALDAKNRVRRDFQVAKGTLTSCQVHPREVFRPLIRMSAARCVLVHNHPSGDPTPSREDLELTTRLVQSGELVGIQVLDHVIVASRGYASAMG